MGVKEFLAKALHKDGRFKELEREMRIQKIVEQRQKNSNERELEGYLEEERQKTIKKNLEEFRKAKTEEMWKSNLLEQKNIFKGHQSILKNNDKLFSMKSNKFKGGMFFK